MGQITGFRAIIALVAITDAHYGVMKPCPRMRRNIPTGARNITMYRAVSRTALLAQTIDIVRLHAGRCLL